MAAPSAHDEVGLVAERLAVVLSAGITPATAAAYVTRSAAGLSATAVGVVTHLGRGVTPPAIVGNGSSSDLSTSPPSTTDSPAPQPSDAHSVTGSLDPAWTALIAAWQLAVVVGAPLGPSLQAIADSARSLASSEREAGVAMAGPRSTARLMSFLPAVGLVFALVLGVNPIAVLTSSPLGWVAVIVGLVLMFVARRWSARMIRGATRVDTVPGVTLDLMAIAVSAGGAQPRARSLVDSLWRGPAVDPADSVALDRVLALSSSAGVPAAALLRSEAALLRRAAASAMQQRVAALGSRLMLPLGCCILPAFMILAVMPVVGGIISSTVTELR